MQTFHFPYIFGEAPMHKDNHTIGQSMQQCIEACFSCVSICDRCSDDMIGMDADKHMDHTDKDLMQVCIRLCQDCADICTLSARWMSRLSPSADLLYRLCADICDRCAETCERHAPHHALCSDCAAECRRCAGLCRELGSVNNYANQM
ncbi:MAG: four-helix bundle copper-binding protein [Nitrospirota bacterium]